MSAAAPQAKFLTGSTFRHVLVMTATGSVGLIAVFAVDALNLFYIAMLGEQELAAAIGYAGTLMFFLISIAIGMTVAASALVARALGRGQRDEAAERGGAALVFTAVIVTAITLAAWPNIRALTALLGASGHTLDLATRFLQIVLPSTILMALGMCASGILRGVGDARRAMYVTLGGALASAILDPVLIFWFGLGIDGAAIATVISRLVLLLVGFHGAIVIHRLARWPRMPALRQSLRPFTAIAGPATMTQLATPVGNAFVTVEIAAFGDDAVAGWAIVGRLVPVAFGAVFALSGAVGPIIGQNYGARRYERVQSTMRDSLVFTLVNVLVMWALLALFHRQIADLFDADGLARTMVEFFCLYAAGSFLFNGALFVANAAFNNLGHALYSTLFNWGRATLGVIPFVWAGAALYGAEGILAGWGLGAVVFGIASVIVCFRIIGRLGSDPQAEAPGPDFPPAANSPFTSGKGAA